MKWKQYAQTRDDTRTGSLDERSTRSCAKYMKAARKRRMTIGAEVHEGGVDFRVWAPASREVHVVLAEGPTLERAACKIALQSEEGGYFSQFIPDARAGMHYKLQLDHGLFPDPVSRFQPDGPHGASRIVDPRQFQWSDNGWRGIDLKRQVLYEMHLGTFTDEGSWTAAAGHLPELADLGVTTLEIMPVADFPGRYGWGYDGVSFFAPTRLYGEPDDFRAFVNRAHQLGLGVILDVVYNHLGPDGNYLRDFSPDYFSAQRTEWGDALNFDGNNSQPVREFFVSNAAYWIEEYHLDGLRLDATQQIFDRSADHILAEITRAVRRAAGGRSTFVVAENEPQQTRLVRSPQEGGDGLDALWNDDFHHSARVAATGRREAYYSDYQGAPQEFVSAAKWGYLFQGQRYDWQKTPRGTAGLDLQPGNFVVFLENHDQVANSLRGQRLHTLTHPGLLRALTALLLLGPGTPMLFQGQEFAASAPFIYFADHHLELAEAVAKGRAEFLRQFPSVATPEATACLPHPQDEANFRRCKLDFRERAKHREIYALHKDLLGLRRDDPLLGSVVRGRYDGAVLGDAAFLLRFFGEPQNDRLMVVNLGADLHLHSIPEPLLAPPGEQRWRLHWSSEDPRYGGGGTPPVETEAGWRLPAYSAILLIGATPDGRCDAARAIDFE